MFKRLRINKKIKFFLLMLVILCIVFIIVDFLKSNNRNDLNNKLNISLARMKTFLDENITNRKVIILENEILIGENEKQLENNYYDIKVSNQNDEKIIININKLWKMFDEKLYEKQYVYEVSNSISHILQYNINCNEIADYIITGYTEAKSNNKYKLENTYFLDINNYRLEGVINNKEFVILIYLNN